MNKPLPSLEYLLECSEMSLRDLELAALDRAAQCKKRAKMELDESVAQQEAAGVARWLIDNRAGILDAARRTLDAQEVLPFRKSA